MTTLNQLIGYRIIDCRSKLNLTQDDLAKELNTTRNQISYFENGRRKPTVEQIKKMAEIFNVSTDYLLTVSEVATNDIELQAVCKYLRLDEKAVKSLRDRTVSPSKECEEESNRLLNFLIGLLPLLHGDLLEYGNHCRREAVTLQRIEKDFKDHVKRVRENKYKDENSLKKDVLTLTKISDEFYTIFGARRGLLYDIPNHALKYSEKAFDVSELVEYEEEVSELIEGWFEEVISNIEEEESVADGEHKENKE